MATSAGSRNGTIEVYTVGFDPDRVGVGSGPGPGNPVSSRLFIPSPPTTGADNRYLFALCGITVPRNATYHVRGFGQKLLIGQRTVNPLDGSITIHEKPVSTPDWAFPDGNVTWSIRFIKGIRKTAVLKPPVGASPLNAGPSKTQNPYSSDSALFYKDSIVTQYEAPMGGEFPGDALVQPGTFYDMRNPWQGLWQNLLDIPVKGPGEIVMFASVFQTNPQTRPVFTPPPGFNPDGLVPEDQFLLDFPGAIYRHIAGRMLIQVS